MNKKNILVATGITVASAAAVTTAVMIINKIRKNKNNENTNEDTSSVSRVTNTDVSTLLKFIRYLCNNGVDSKEIACICETISRIKTNLPDKYPVVRERMLGMIEHDFDINDSRAFDKDNFTLLYTSIDPRQLFGANGLKVLALGPDYQDSMKELEDAIVEIKENDASDAISLIYEIYHIFNGMDIENITGETFDTVFKPYIEKLVSTLDTIEDASVDENTNT